MRGANGKISQIRLSAEAKVWAEAAKRANCPVDPGDSIRRSESIRSDFSLLLWSQNFDNPGGLVKYLKHSRAEETSIADWNGMDEKHPAKFYIDISKMIQSEQPIGRAK